MLTLLSFAAPAPSPTVPSAEAQRAWEWRGELRVPWRDVDGNGWNDYSPNLWYNITRLTPFVRDRCEHIRQFGPFYLSSRNFGGQAVIAITWGNRTPECRLSVEWGEERNSGVKGIKWTLVPDSIENRVTSWDSPVTRATYTDGRTFYSPQLNFVLPRSVPTVLYGERFEVEYRWVASTHGACRLHRDVDSEEWYITDTGTIERHPDSRPVELIDSPAGLSDTCSYEMTWPEIEGFVKPDEDAVFSGTQQAQTGTYANNRVNPELEIQLPGAVPVALRNEPFSIEYAHATNSPASCKMLDVQSADWLIGADGIPRVTNQAALVAYPQAARDDLCLYEVVWPDIAGLVKPTDRPIIAPVLGSHRARGVYTLDVSVQAEGTWVHEIEITIPFLDLDEDGINDYDPQFSFPVQPRPVSPGSDVGSWTLPGAVCPTPWNGGPRPDLVVKPRISKEPGTTLIANAQLPGLTDGCRLATEFPRTIASGVPGVTLQANLDCKEASTCRWHIDFPSHEKFTNSSRTTAKVTYEDGRLQMRPDLTINLPDPLPAASAGAEFVVRFEPDRPECRAGPNVASQRWRINAQGEARPASSAPALLRSEAGGNLADDDDFCEIEVVWPHIPGLVRPEQNAVLRPSWRSWATDNRASGTYRLPWGTHSDTTYYHPTVHQQGGLVINARQGMPSNISYEVSIAPAAGSHVGCDADPDSSKREKTYSIRAPVQPLNPDQTTYPSAVRFTTEGRQLVLVPGNGVSSSCSYVAVFPTDEAGSSANYPTNARTGPGLRTNITPTSAVANNRYAATSDRAEVQVRTASGVTLAEGEVWSVSAQVSPAAGSPTQGCTETHMVEAREDRTGAHFIVAPLDLVWEDPLTTQACTYDVAFPPLLAIGSQRWRVDPDYSSDQVLTVSRASRIARQRYAVDELLDGEIEVLVAQSVDADAEFSATITASNDPAVEGCSDEQPVSVAVTTGDQSASVALVGLVKRQAGVTGDCEYSVEFDETEVGGNLYRLDPRFDAPVTTLSDASLTARQRYTADTFFDGEVVVRTAAAVAADTSFLVQVAASNDPPIMGCSAPPDASVTVLAGAQSATLELDDLVLRVADAAGDCEYVVTFPPHEDGFAAAYAVDGSFADAKLTMTAAEPTAQQQYALNVSPSPGFDGTVEVVLTEVVSVDTDFAVSVAPVAGGPDGCSMPPAQTATVAADAQSAMVTFAGLLQTPLGAASDCSYEVTLPADVLGEDAHWFPDAMYAAVTTLAQGATAASQQYEPRVRLYPTTGPNAARVLVWNTEDVPPTASFEVTVAAPSAPTGCGTYVTAPMMMTQTTVTQTVTASAVLDSPSEVTFSGDNQLIRRPALASIDCEYTVTFGEDEVGTTADYVLDDAFDDADLVITPASPVAQHRYARSATSEQWTMRVELGVPFRDVNGNGVNDYDPPFVVGVQRSATSDDAGGLCPQSSLRPSLRGAAGTETVAAVRVAGMAPGCQLMLTANASHASGLSGITLEVASGTSVEATVDKDNPTWRLPYFDGRTSFEPEVTVTLPDPVPAEAVDEAFVVRFVPTSAGHEACGVHADDDHEDWTVTSAGAMRDTGSRATLVGVPAGTTDTCVYEVTWPEVAGLVAPSASTLTYVSGDPTSWQVAARYVVPSAQTDFAPDMVLDVPVVDYDGDGMHDYGATVAATGLPPTGLAVRFSPQASSVGEGCSPADSTVTYTVIADTSAPAGESGVRTRFEVSPAGFTLIDRPENSEHRCRYDAVFDVSDAVGGAAFRRVERVATPATDDTEAWADDPGVSATYATADQVRSVAFELTAEAAGDGATFTVPVAVVAPPQSNDRFARCTGVTLDAGGAVTASSMEVVLTADATGTASGTADLVDWPAGHDAPADRCGYEVRWPDNEDGATVYARIGEATTALDAAVFGQATPMVSNTYSSAADEFDATIELVTAPDVAAGVTFAVTINQVGTLANCSSQMNLSVPAAAPTADGSDAQTDHLVEDLVDRPAGSTQRCAYVVEWPATDAAAGTAAVRDDTFAFTTALSSDSRTATGRYQAPEPPPALLEPVAPEPTAPEPEPEPEPQPEPTAPEPPAPEPVIPDSQDPAQDQTQNPQMPQDQDPQMPQDPAQDQTQNQQPQDPAQDQQMPQDPAEDPAQNQPQDQTQNPQQPQNPAQGPAQNQPQVQQPEAPRTPTVVTPQRTGGTTRSTGGGGGSRGGSSGGGSSGGASSGPWQVATSSRLPVSVSVVTPSTALPAPVPIEVLINVPGTCGDDVTTFAGMPAEIGLVYALTVQPGATVDVLADDALRLPSHAARGDSTRGCELRVTLIAAPVGCTLAGSKEDDAGRPYVDADGDEDATSYALTPSLACG